MIFRSPFRNSPIADLTVPAKRGLKKGDVFAIMSPNLPKFATALLGVVAAGGVVTTMNPLYTAKGAKAQTRFELLWSYFTHTAHHRGQAEVYLRLKDIKPPTYIF